MAKDSTILNELREISPLLAGLERVNVFTVPQDYFDKISSSILLKLDQDQISGKAMALPLEAPAGYFENLSSNILSRIKSESLHESNEVFPALLNEKINLPFNLPENYFESLPSQILNKVKANNEKAKVVSFHIKRIYRYAAAAVIILGLLTTSYFLFNHSDKDKNGFAVVNKQTVQDPDALQYNSKKAFNEGIAALTDDQIAEYLKEHGNLLDIDLLINNTDANEMPEPNEYLENENALYNYLDKINNKESGKQ